MTAPVRAAVLWDIDGTLLTTARAGVAALEDAVLEVVGRPADLGTLYTSGFTDGMVARAVLGHIGLDPDPVVEQALLEVYTRELSYRLTLRRGRVMEGVVEILECLQSRDDVVVALLTGNMREGARAKLASYGLERFFDFDFGGFGDDGYERTEIATAFLARLRRRHRTLGEQIYLVGDTPFDIACGKELGLRTVAVASGLHVVDELAASEPWWSLERLPKPDEFIARLELD